MMNFQENLSKIRMRNGDWRDEGVWLGGTFRTLFETDKPKKEPLKPRTLMTKVKSVLS